MESQSTILVVEDSDATRTYLQQVLAEAGHEVLAASNVDDGRGLIEARSLDIALIDLGLAGRDGRELLDTIQRVSPDVPVIIVTADNTATTAVELLHAGAFDYVVKPFDIDHLQRVVSRGIELCAARRALGNLRDVRSREDPKWDVGQTPRMKMLERLVAKFADTGASVLIEGESGTGKEVVAKSMHYRSKRADGPFIGLNCAALPGQLLESQLFGHEKGSFTSATSMQRGLLELADKGTLFLDEVSSMSLEAQAKLLRALQEKTIRRLGGQREIRIDVRVISASNKRVVDAIAAGTFREDLFFRLCVITIELPPLRQRAVDIPFFVLRFMDELRRETGSSVRGVSDAAMWVLCQYPWPGNIRELHNVVEGAMIMASGEETIDVGHLPATVLAAEAAAGHNGRDGASAPAHLPTVLPADGLSLKEIECGWERALIEQALSRTDGNQSGAARLLGLTRDELRYRVEKFGIGVPAVAPEADADAVAEKAVV